MVVLIFGWETRVKKRKNDLGELCLFPPHFAESMIKVDMFLNYLNKIRNPSFLEKFYKKMKQSIK
jgi:hypothetical protein